MSDEFDNELCRVAGMALPRPDIVARIPVGIGTPADPQWVRMEEIRRNMDIPGGEGAYWRLLARMDTAIIMDWIRGERLWQTPPDQLGEAISAAVTDLVFAGAQQVKRPYMKPFARDILTTAAALVDDSIGKLSTVAREKTRRTFKLITGGA